MARQESRSTNGKSRNADQTMAAALEQFKEATAGVYEAVGNIGSASAHSARSQVEEGKQKATEMTASAESLVQERPMTSLAVAFAAGWLVSRLLQSGK